MARKKFSLSLSSSGFLLPLVPLLLLFTKALLLLQAGFIPFWHDPGRDLLLAQEHLKKFTLLGPPAGIPGVFYLPYWTWWNSLALIFTSDPRWITLVNITLPYFILLPVLFLLFIPLYGRAVTFSLGLLFFVSFFNLVTQFWSPNLGPLILLALIYLVVFVPREVSTIKFYIWYLFTGLLTGANLGFNMGFGLVASFLTLLFLFLDSFFKKDKKVFLAFLLGLFLSLLPFLAFEIRHGFNQSRALISIIMGTTRIDLAGLSKPEILQRFLKLPSQILQLPAWLTVIIFVPVLLRLVHQNVKLKLHWSYLEKRLSYYTAFLLFGLALVYFWAKNPKWDYHFIGVETLFLLLIGLVALKTGLKYLLASWTAVVLFVFFIFPAPANFSQNLYLSEKLKIIDFIYSDAKGKNFAVSAYSPAIYTYDYDYLFRWLGREKYHPLPTADTSQVTSVYLIVPPTSSQARTDFVDFKTPEQSYKTVSTWKRPDGTTIYKRVINRLETKASYLQLALFSDKKPDRHGGAMAVDHL